MKVKNNDIIKLKKEKNNKTIDDKYSSIVYTIKGQEDYIDDNGNPVVNSRSYIRQGKEYSEDAASQPQALAKISKGRVQQYYIKIERNGMFINPKGLYSQDGAGRIIEHRISASRKFVPVNKKCFDLYMRFLRTGLEKYLLQAQREI